MSELQSLITDFTARLTALIQGDALARARENLLAAFGDGPPKRRGRAPKTLSAVPVAPPILKSFGKPRRKAPVQLCPVPNCKNPAAPIFGMVCSKHKDLPKAKIKKFREARRARKLGLSG
jgi:hypothetical protein